MDAQENLRGQNIQFHQSNFPSEITTLLGQETQDENIYGFLLTIFKIVRKKIKKLACSSTILGTQI